MRVLGLTGKETPVQAPYKTFCNICKRRILQGEECLLDIRSVDKAQVCLHVDCGIAELEVRMHSAEFRELAKNRPKTRKTRQTAKKVHTGDGTRYCKFCRKAIAEGQEFYKDKKATYHKSDCWSRYQGALKQPASSLRRM